MKTELYRLPDGRLVSIDADVARGAASVSYQLANGRIVPAVRVPEVPVRYEVAIHYHGRKMIRRGPCEGLLEWPAHQWVRITNRPVGLERARALADAQGQHAVVCVWSSAEKVYDNAKAPAVPEGWWPASAQSVRDPRVTV